MSRNARWLGEDEFPSDQPWADEVEAVLSFAGVQGQFEARLGRLRGNCRQRDAALAELRVAFFFHRNGFRILEWEPIATLRAGDLLIQWPGTAPIFVEIKAPDWEGELSGDERSMRKRLPKDISGEARWVDPVGAVLSVVEDGALPKFSDSTPNLVVVHDNLFVSPALAPGDVLQESLSTELRREAFRRVGGLFFVHPVLRSPFVEVVYATLFVENPRGLPACRIPSLVSSGLQKSYLREASRGR
jgi:hypothetical protein